MTDEMMINTGAATPWLAAAAALTLASLGHAWINGAEDDDKNLTKAPSKRRIFTSKLGGLFSHHLSSRPQRPDWEVPIAENPNLHMHPRVSRLATSASGDGLILKDMPRIYAPFTKFTDEDMQAEDHDERLASRGVKCVWHFGKEGVGHPQTVHGGCIAMAFDESFGHAFLSLRRGMGFTAFLNINYRAPLPTGNATLIEVSFDKLQGRKVSMSARLTDGKGKVFSDATCLFVLPKDAEPAQ
mmetsp:Transcript_30670/g.59962  ORF Transcript_30670/g.59962 Transcript_30670/m.59962 type:complete len:242 (-) Transcript_30670:294-1019(-)|eukprot:CAMPEP_0173414914 /NCGR_PEP_ID=MMETSP1356-20130122/84576_1 /TAXON_ID=77927 ORGANISM="Hemiselmis virescens, Strain PCC157" /NCGR_SAMPLE_ID=MMETSP1356 /ASSEMBLY_ACC=CAM_ASM_000847 /LENGTH=241 /DNA_ID=CAMNT_0014377123 /DNA_START=427 /DNA_END=1152 /DNA_ORIENTATION=-